MRGDALLLEFHRKARDGVRAVLRGLPLSQVRRRDRARGFSIADEIGHLVAAEHWFIREDFHAEPGFPCMNGRLGQRASLRSLRTTLRRIEEAWPRLLEEHPRSRPLREILARMGLHTLNHLPRIADRRVRGIGKSHAILRIPSAATTLFRNPPPTNTRPTDAP